MTRKGNLTRKFRAYIALYEQIEACVNTGFWPEHFWPDFFGVCVQLNSMQRHIGTTYTIFIMGEVMRRPPAVVESPFHKFVLFDAPDDTTLPGYIEELRRYDVTHVVRTCEPTYNVEPMNKAGIEVHDLCFVDGGVPPPDIIDKWLAILHSTAVKEPDKAAKKTAIGVHCVAGLGRTPVMVAIALIESGTNALDAVATIRKQRKGAVNKPQLEFLQKYKKRSKKKGCIVM